MFGFGKSKRSEQEQKFFNDFGIDASELPYHTVAMIQYMNLTSNNNLSTVVKTALLYRIEALFLAVYIRDERHKTGKLSSELMSLTSVILDTSFELSNSAKDQQQLITITASFNDSIEEILCQSWWV